MPRQSMVSGKHQPKKRKRCPRCNKTYPSSFFKDKDNGLCPYCAIETGIRSLGNPGWIKAKAVRIYKGKLQILK